jgi:uncharacterized protein YfbU (UPF0304 family)
MEKGGRIWKTENIQASPRQKRQKASRGWLDLRAGDELCCRTPLFIELSHDGLSKNDKGLVEKNADPYGKRVAFRGFDGNNETEHLGIARFLINELNRFSHFKDRDLNSHMPSIDGYRRMLRVFEPMKPNLGGGNDLTAGQIIDVLNAQRHDRI